MNKISVDIRIPKELRETNMGPQSAGPKNIVEIVFID